MLPQEILDDDFKLSGCFIPSSLNECDLKITLFKNIVGKYFWSYDLCISSILGFPDYILNGIR